MSDFTDDEELREAAAAGYADGAAYVERQKSRSVTERLLTDETIDGEWDMAGEEASPQHSFVRGDAWPERWRNFASRIEAIVVARLGKSPVAAAEKHKGIETAVHQFGLASQDFQVRLISFTQLAEKLAESCLEIERLTRQETSEGVLCRDRRCPCCHGGGTHEIASCSMCQIIAGEFVKHFGQLKGAAGGPCPSCGQGKNGWHAVCAAEADEGAKDGMGGGAGRRERVPRGTASSVGGMDARHPSDPLKNLPCRVGASEPLTSMGPDEVEARRDPEAAQPEVIPSAGGRASGGNAQTVEGEIERLLNLAQKQHDHLPHYVRKESCVTRDLAALARRLAKEAEDYRHNAEVVILPLEVKVEALVDERDEARRLHDEHCGAGTFFGTQPSACTPPWRPR